ncbi:amino acid ABC transporter ATP-binding protein [Levilactobacillus brevis]|mgnify:FL=1|jgi:polar amino acid transport system ATP-binding protein|uniref:Amino acid ABC transporter ATP-binding protein n=2 Tax=Levilactobacillus brevis TaxID=1580 RepID=A0AB38X6P1_LEVBR|nr:amino acid ABC transporter ATP-binding protein [Levilactobacillus brevis]MBL3537635.1 amino acid ABC transporter ATP-binding protein [Lactobacillus sp. GPR40-2]MBL3630793.1 amino acid ABC transporter ATP-binding protein [Lactobacillus sp. GPB7-4]ARQ93679.1 polar amino acid ABC transporter ATP-binding protein [Levilactobacillus brevis]KLE29810.1 polar amino acid ABC transporter ATPase [Levilactobacillus brevis]KWT49951.1 polar amino acid ABC transporter ATPase [Levilactobacillus brevis]
MLELKGITKKFGSKTILDNLNLTVTDGKILTIVGPSGAGKTTLLRCISGLETVDSGQFLLDGQPFDPATNRDNDAVIGVVFQDYQLFPNLTVRQNVTLAPTMVLKQSAAEANETAQTLLAQLNLADQADLYPYELSGGQKQRVAIVRALAMRPKLLCYDEPTSALDPDLRREVQQIIVQLRDEGITQIVVTHDIPFAEAIADQMLRVEAKS